MNENSSKIRVLIAGGGTGGHVFPAIAVANVLREKGALVTFVGTRRGLECQIVPKKGWKIHFISVPRLKGEAVVNKLKLVFYAPGLLLKSLLLLRRLKPDVVIGVGGYASGPVTLVAALLGIPSLIMEQNSIPGFTNKVLGRFTKRICISFPLTKKYFKEKKVMLTGNPVRREIIAAVGSGQGESPGVPPIRDRFVVLCFGGSAGARRLSEGLLASLKYLLNRKGSLLFIHQIGHSMDIDTVKDIYSREGFSAEVYEFIDDIADCYRRAHLVLCRAGATSIAELTVMAKPSVLVPYPYAASGHQEMNAKYLVGEGGATMLTDDEVSGEKVSEVIKDFMASPEKLYEMSEAVAKLARPDAAKAIAEECLKLAV